MRAARDWQVSWRVFHGAPRDTPFDERDRAMAVALRVYEDGLCPGCGRPIDDVWRSTEFGRWDAEPITCGACHAIESKQAAEDAAIAAKQKVRGHGMHWSAHRKGETPLSAHLRPPDSATPS